MERLIEQFQLELPGISLSQRFNIAPTQMIAALRLDPAKDQRCLALLKWGLVPSWAKDPKIGSRMINARGETVAEKPSFRSAFKNRRCLILADGYYEWQNCGPKRPKQPYFIEMSDKAPFAMAGIWESWRASTDECIETCSIITTNANELTSSIHDRMPVILDPSYYSMWLDTRTTNRPDLESLLQPFLAGAMQINPVSTFVNKPQNDSEKCIETIEVIE